MSNKIKYVYNISKTEFYFKWLLSQLQNVTNIY
jgi:hypothetical protein